MTPERSRSWGAVASLLAASIIWGFTFVAQRSAMEHVSPFSFNGVRFLLGSLSLVPAWIFVRRRERRKSITKSRSNRSTWLLAGAIGLSLFAGATLQQVGLVYTTAGKAGFITGLYVILVPVIGLFLGQRVRWTVWTGATIALGGLYLLTGFDSGGLSLGDGLVLASAFAWAAHVQLVGVVVHRMHPVRIALVQTAICGTLSLVVGLLAEPGGLAGLDGAIPALLFAGVASVGIAYSLQIAGQRGVAPARAGIIVSLEAVFAVLGGWLLLGEQVSGILLAGCALILAGTVLSQLGRRSRLEGWAG